MSAWCGSPPLPATYEQGEAGTACVIDELGSRSFDFVRSPGGWSAPPGTRPGWDWVPPSGARPRPDLMGRWIRLWYRMPFVDRYAHM